MQRSEILNWLTSAASHCTGGVLLAHATYAKYFKVFLLCVAAHLIPCHMLRKLPIRKINLPCVVKGLHSSTKVPTSHTQSGSRSCARWFLLESTVPQGLTCVWRYFSSIWRLWSRQLKKREFQTLPCYSVTDARGTVAGFPAFHSIATIGTLWKKKYSKAILSDPSQLLS